MIVCSSSELPFEFVIASQNFAHDKNIFVNLRMQKKDSVPIKSK